MFLLHVFFLLYVTLKDVPLRLRSISDAEDKFYKRSLEYQQYRIDRDYNAQLKIKRSETRQSKTFTIQSKNIVFFKQYNSLLNDFNNVTKANLSFLSF